MKHNEGHNKTVWMSETVVRNRTHEHTVSSHGEEDDGGNKGPEDHSFRVVQSIFRINPFKHQFTLASYTDSNEKPKATYFRAS